MGRRDVCATALSAALAAALLAGGAAWAQDGRLTRISYGYGAESQRGGPTLDLRRSAPPTRDVFDAPALDESLLDPDETDEGGVQAEPVRNAAGAEREDSGLAGFEQTGVASWYGENFRGRTTASGEAFNPDAPTGAHLTLPLPSLVQVTNLENGRTLVVRVNDRGPSGGEARGRVIDLSQHAAEQLGFRAAGEARVHVRYLGRAPRHVSAVADQDGPINLLPQRTDADAAAADIGVQEEPPLVADAQESAAVQPPISGGFVVQVGAYSDPANADRVRSALADAGTVTVDARQIGARQLYRVRVGPLADRDQAEGVQRVVATLGFPDAIVAPR
ncbi:MAG: septal ring lytic transglycosylase RlpA family protein [Hyphomonadaceae bacterium]